MSETLTEELLKSLARLPERFGELLSSISSISQKVDLLNTAAEQRGLKAEQRADALHESMVAMEHRTSALEENDSKILARLESHAAMISNTSASVDRLHAFKARATLVVVGAVSAFLVYELMAGGKLGQLIAKIIGAVL